MKLKILWPLIVILFIAGLLRFYQLGQIPPSLSWDEASIGYDAYAVLHYGQDQWGRSWPLVFQSFGENKYPLHIYATFISIVLFGLNDQAVRLPSAFMGLVDIALLFILVKKITGNQSWALWSAFLLAISPWDIQFSRVNWETNFALFFFFLGLWFFYSADKKKRWFWILAFLSWGIDLYTYNAAKVFLPLFLAWLILVHRMTFWKNKIWSLSAFLLFGLIILAGLIIPQLSGLNRLSQVGLDKNKIYQSETYQLTHNKYLAAGTVVISQYFSHFSPQFLFISGDANPRHSDQMNGELSWWEGLFLLIGLGVLIKKRNLWTWTLLGWFLLAPVPSSLFSEAPHASRSMFALGGWQIISALGVTTVAKWKNKFLSKKIITTGILLGFVFSVWFYGENYFIRYPQLSSADWQYSYNQLFVRYQSQFASYDKILITDEYGQPYIFALYHLAYSQPQFRQTVVYNPESDWGFSTVKSFDKFVFGKVDIRHLPTGRLLIFATPSEKINSIMKIGEIDDLNGKPSLFVYERPSS